MPVATSTPAKASLPAAVSASIEYFSIQLSPTSDGLFYVGIEGTVCMDEELSRLEMGHHRVASLEEALAVIRDAVSTAH